MAARWKATDSPKLSLQILYEGWVKDGIYLLGYNAMFRMLRRVSPNFGNLFRHVTNT